MECNFPDVHLKKIQAKFGDTFCWPGEFDLAPAWELHGDGSMEGNIYQNYKHKQVFPLACQFHLVRKK